MFLHEVFSPDLIKTGLEAEEKGKVFEELTDLFCQAKKTDIREEILEALWERESRMTTGIQKGVAIPHGRSGALESIHGILGISKRGVDYDALDDHPVHLVFMILAPESDTDEYLLLLKRLAKLLDNQQFHTDLLAESEPERVNRVIKEYEDSHFASEKAKLLMDEHDVLQHLLDLENKAAALVNNAQARAEQKVSEGERKDRLRYDETYAHEVEALEASYSKEVAAEKENYRTQLEAYRESLKTQPADIEAFSSLTEKFLIL